MAEAARPPQTDRDLASIAEARALARRAKQAGSSSPSSARNKIDAIVDAMAAAATAQAEAFARLAVEETGYGVVEDKIQKNLFSSQKVYNFIRPMKTVGVIARHEDRRVVEIAEPFGVVAAVVPSTNPTSTAIYKILISLKARCSIVLSPHPAAVKCITRVAEVMDEAARRAGAPQGAINWMTTVTLEGTQELMKHRDVAVILATGGMGLVRAAYSAGKPAYGVGPGNAPAYIERTADVKKAVRDVVTGKTFDNGVLCSSENSVVVDESIAEAVKREFQAQGGYFMSKAEMDAVARVLVSPQRLPNPALVGKAATVIAEKCGITVPAETRVLIAPLDGVGRDYPLSIEKLCPVLSFYVVKDWREGCERCKQILRYGGMGHTMSIHSQNDQVILEFGLKKPAFRIVVNYADDARIDRPDDGAGSGDDARVRRLRRQHHVRQHLAPASAEHQASRVRNLSGRQSIRTRSWSRGRHVEQPPRRACPTGGTRGHPRGRADRRRSISSSALAASNPARATADSSACRRSRSASIRWQSRSTSSARKTCGSRSRRAGSSSSRSGRSSRRPRAISANSIAYSLSRPGADNATSVRSGPVVSSCCTVLPPSC